MGSKRCLAACLTAVGALSVFLSACAPIRERNTVPEELIDAATVSGVPEARFWGDALPADMDDRLAALEAQTESYGPP